MTLSDLASIATIIEAIFVVISVFFIWRELRENTRLTKATKSQSLVEISSPFNLQLIQDRQMAEFWVLGARKFADMDEVDQYRYRSLLAWWLILHENIYYQRQNNLLEENIYTGWAHDLEEFVRQHDFASHWSNVKGNYQPEFAGHVSRLIEKLHPVAVVSESTKA